MKYFCYEDRYEQHASEVSDFLVAHPELADLVQAVEALSDDMRLALFRLYCRECGDRHSSCSCSNDD